MKKSAVISECGKYRYELTRDWSEDGNVFPGGNINFVMLNPSTADASIDDPTIRKCIGFAKHNGYDSLKVVNIFAYRSSKPKILYSMHHTGFDVHGPANEGYLLSIPKHETVVAAWGASFYAETFVRLKINQVKTILDRKLLCVKKTENRPWHPLYVSYGQFLPLENV